MRRLTVLIKLVSINHIPSNSRRWIFREIFFWKNKWNILATNSEMRIYINGEFPKEAIIYQTSIFTLLSARIRWVDLGGKVVYKYRDGTTGKRVEGGFGDLWFIYICVSIKRILLYMCVCAI